MALAGAGALCFASSASAISVEPDDVPNQTYIIGTHMFTRDKNAAYPGYITTKSIMLAAQTIEGDSLDDMKVYYKTARGVWVNGLTNQQIDKPANFDIVKRNLSTCDLNANAADATTCVCYPEATSIEEASCMQDINEKVKSTISLNGRYELIDIRDGRSYSVSKLADGQIWMRSDLALGSDSPMILTSADSDVSEDYTLPASSDSGWNTGSAPKIYNRYNLVYYNWYAATANSSIHGDNNASHSICPKGWRLPSGGKNGELKTLYTSYANYDAFKEAVSPDYAGYFDYLNPGYGGGSGLYWWSSTAFVPRNSAYILHGGSSNDTDYADAHYGYSIRCIAG